MDTEVLTTQEFAPQRPIASNCYWPFCFAQCALKLYPANVLTSPIMFHADEVISVPPKLGS